MINTNIRLLWTEKGKVIHVKKSLNVYTNPETRLNSYFVEYQYKGYLKVKILLSKNQKRKYLKFGKIPHKAELLKTFALNDNSSKTYKNKGFNKIQIGNLIFITKLLSDVDISDNSNIFKLFINHILY